jgi:YceI-like domain
MTTTLTEQRAAAPTRWSVDDAESSVEFAVKTLWGLTTVRGRFDRFDGTYEIGPGGTTRSTSTTGAGRLTSFMPCIQPGRWRCERGRRCRRCRGRRGCRRASSAQRASRSRRSAPD